jgi:folate-dependent phosphoribosylglycinamide formyltransferase PurN
VIEPQRTIVVFAYDFPHRKSQDVITALVLGGHPVHAVIGAPPVDLGIPTSSVRTKLRRTWVLHPVQVAERLGASYAVMPHEGSEIESFLRELHPDLGIIAGARILKGSVISRFRHGILNLHPGLIPEVRGLDAMLWAIRRDSPLGVTAHLIDQRVDAGTIVARTEIPVFRDDSAVDLTERLYETELTILPEAVACALRGEGQEVGLTDPANRKMPPKLERETLAMLPDYLLRHASETAA